MKETIKTGGIKSRVMALEHIRWVKLKKYQFNDLKLGKRVNLEKLQVAIEKHGFCFPFFVWAGNDYVIDGTGRFQALKQMEKAGFAIPDLPVVYIEADSFEAAKQLVAQASSEFGETTQESLAAFCEDFELDFDTVSFPGLDLDQEITTLEPEGDPDDVPDVPDEPVTKLGDLYEIGSHRLLCGDSTKLEDVERLMNGDKADMVFTDPPYGMRLNADFSGAKSSLKFASEKGLKGGNKYNNVIGDHDDFTPELIQTVFTAFPYVKELFLWGADYYAELIPDRNSGSFIIWDKRLDESTDRMYGSCFETCWSKARHKRDIARVKWAGVFGTEKEPDKRRHHPTQKPVELVKWFFDRWGSVADVVADLFLGAGSTMVASQQTGRKCFGMELDPHYCDVIVSRMRSLWPDLEIKRNGELI